MKRFHEKAIVGIRDKETNKLIAVYPHPVEGNDKEIEDKVNFWFYQQSCSSETVLENSFVDNLTSIELKNHNIPPPHTP